MLGLTVGGVARANGYVALVHWAPLRLLFSKHA